MSDNLSEYADAALYEAENGWGPGDDFYLALARRTGGPVLDLCCGTGLLAVALADSGLAVEGLDLMAPMLRHARARPGGRAVPWHLGDMRDFTLDRRFALVIMTGHAWQALLTDEDQEACLATVRRHLLPGGRFAFETRNPAVTDFGRAGEMAFWRDFTDPQGQRVETWTASTWEADTGIENCRVERRWPATGRTTRSSIVLRHGTADALDRRLAAAGFSVEERHGDFTPATFDPRASPEIITVARIA